MSNITLKAIAHPSGRRTLTRSDDGGTPIDLRGPLFGSLNSAKFDKAKDEMAAELRREGHEVEIIE
jgi:hypothetical protein